MRSPWCRLLLTAALSALTAVAAPAAGCLDAPIVDGIAESAWVNIDLVPAEGTTGIRDALRRAQTQHPTQPVRIRLAPGTYADTLGNEIFAQALWRSAQAPIWLLATDSRPDATVLAWQPYGTPGLLVADLDLSLATGLLAARCRAY